MSVKILVFPQFLLDSLFREPTFVKGLMLSGVTFTEKSILFDIVAGWLLAGLLAVWTIFQLKPFALFHLTLFTHGSENLHFM